MAPQLEKLLYQRGTLREILFDAYQVSSSIFDGYPASTLVHLLAVPIRLHNTSDHNARQPNRAAQLQGGHCATDSEVLVRPSQNYKRAEAKDGDEDALTHRSIGISSLPVELHHQIFDNLYAVANLADVFCLGLTSQYF